MKHFFSLFVSKTLLFIGILVFISTFTTIFGDTHALVGVTTLILLLSSLGMNLTLRPGRNFVIMLAANLLLGFAAFIAPLNLWLGLIVNFIIIFAIGYFGTFELKKSLVPIIGLHYLLMLTTPLPVEAVPMRLLALVVGPILIMALQLLLKRHALKKTVTKHLQELQKDLVLPLQNNSRVTNLTFQPARQKLAALKHSVYTYLPTQTIPNAYQQAVLALVSHCETLIGLLESNANALDESMMQDLATQLLAAFSEPYQLPNWEHSNLATGMHKQVTALLVAITQAMTVLNTANPEAQFDTLPEEFSSASLLKRNFHLDNLRVRYALRLALLIASAMFITELFAFEFGRWLLYSLLALTQPYSEYTLERSAKRFVGTIVGAIIIFILFTTIQAPATRTLVMLITGYLMGYVSDYRNTLIFVTISAIASASLTVADPSMLIFTRVLWIVIGIGVALLGNFVFFKSSTVDEAKNIADLQDDIELFAGKYVLDPYFNSQIVSYFYLLTPFIAERMEIARLTTLTERYHLHQQRILILQQLASFQTTAPEAIAEIQDILRSKQTPAQKVAALDKVRSSDTSATAYHIATLARSLITTPY